MPLFESHCGLLGVGAAADELDLSQACGAVGSGGSVFVSLAGVAVLLSAFVFGSVFVGVGAVVGLEQLAMFVCVSPGCGRVHCVLFRSLLGLAVVGVVGLVTAGFVCA
jgi:hypothetical protein